MNKTYFIDGVEWEWADQKWRKVFNSPKKVAMLLAIEKNRQTFSSLSIEEVEELKNLLIENIKLKPTAFDLKELHLINMRVLYVSGFDEWFSTLQKINPGKADSILAESASIQNVDQELNFFNARVAEMKDHHEF